MKTVIVTGVAGQDGSYLADLLLEKGYEVHGIYRRISTGNNFNNLSDAYGNPSLHLHAGDITDSGFMSGLIADLQPDEFFNLAAMSHVGQSFTEPAQTFRVNAEAVVGQLHAIKEHSSHTRFYQASTSELYGGLKCPPGGYTENSPFHPRSPYGVAKLASFWSVVNFREAYGMYACNGILHNHESPRRGLDFAPRKITRGVASVLLGRQPSVKMGNLSACRDIGHAKDYVRGMWMMLQQEKPEDYLIATGTSVSIRQMLDYVCKLAGLAIDDVYERDERYMRPSEVPYLKGDPARIKHNLGWEPEYDWQSLLKEMYESDLKELRASPLS